MDFFLPDVPTAAYSPFEWPQYHLPNLYPAFVRPETIDEKPPGVRIGVWPLYIDEYRSDAEPACQRGPARFVQWHPLTRTDIPEGWRRLPGAKPTLCMGLHNDLTADYVLRWKKNAAYYSRHIKNTLLGQVYSIEPVTFGDFAYAYAHSTVAKEIPTLEIKKLERRLELFPEEVSVWGIRRKEDGKIVAGLTAFDSPQNKASQYGCGFYIPEVSRDHLMVGLMDHWFAASVRKQLRVLHFGLFVPHGQGAGRPKTISDFKAQFITHYLTYQPPLWRYAGKKLL